jgi:hypothetical protein
MQLNLLGEEQLLHMLQCLSATFVFACSGAKLCYNTATHVQALVEPTTGCLTSDEEDLLEVDGQMPSQSATVFTAHFPHPPVSAG